MNKKQFLEELHKRLIRLPEKELQDRINFYAEMIDDRVEEGLTEEQAICEIGSVDKVVNQIIEETPLSKLITQKIKPKRQLNTWEIVLLVLGFPLWFPLLLVGFALVVTFYVVLWSLVITLIAVEVSLFAVSIYGIVVGIYYAFISKVVSGIAFVGLGLFTLGLAIISIYLCKLAVKGTLSITKKLIFSFKKKLVQKEGE